jgi:beta-lactamase regulating signal transducer with metallopeptidase domain
MQQADGMLLHVWMALGAHLWQSGIVLLMILTAVALMRRAPAAFLNALLSIGLFKLLVPTPLLRPLLSGAVDALVGVGGGLGGTRLASPVIDGVIAVFGPGPAALASGGSLDGSVPLALTAVWGLGVSVLAAAGIVRAVRGSATEAAVRSDDAPPDVFHALRRASGGAGVSLRNVRVEDSRIAPHVAGLLRPRIVLPALLARTLPADELGAILLHEEAHRRRREPLRCLLARIVGVALFFYPLVWPLQRLLRETGEMACDEAAVASGARPEAYARALSSLVNLMLGAAPSGVAFDRTRSSTLFRRLERLNEPRRCRMLVRHRVMVAVVVILVALTSVLSMTSLARDATTDIKAPAPPAKPSAPPPSEAPRPPDAGAFHISKMVPPEYPEVAREKNLEAVVLLEIRIDPQMKIKSVEPKAVVVGPPPLGKIRLNDSGKVVEPVEAEGMDAYHDAFIEAAVQAALQWEIEGTPEEGSGEEVALIAPVQFKLDGDKGDAGQKTK